MHDKIVVLGMGNVLRRDEGLGVRALQRLQERFDVPPTVELVDGGTLGLELISYLDQAQRLIVLDAILTDGPPGTLACLTANEVPAFLGIKSSQHEVGLSDLLAVEQLRGNMPDEIVVLGLHPETIELGWELSHAVEAQLDKLVDATIAQLRQWKVSC
jgi:hydrogenase maturation protease